MPVLLKMFVMCRLTVSSLIPSAAAMSRFVSPSLSRGKICRCLGDSILCGPFGRGPVGALEVAQSPGDRLDTYFT